MAEIPAALNAYLGGGRDWRWQPGTVDCGTLIAGWVQLATGIDPIADIRGRYSSVQGFMRIIKREGGFVASCDARLRAAGMVATDAPRAGDVAAVLAPFDANRRATGRRPLIAPAGEKPQRPAGRHPVGAICVSETMRAIVTSDMGLVLWRDRELPLVAAWSFHPHG